MKLATKYILVIVWFFVLINYLILPLVIAGNIQTLGKIRVGDPILLKQNCVNVTYSNITSIGVMGVNTTELITQAISMNLISNGFQTFLFTNSSIIGQYIVTGICDENAIPKTWSYDYEVTPSGTIVSPVQISIYIFFLLLCLFLTYYSVRLVIKNSIAKDNINDSQLYNLHKKSEFLFYLTLLKRKLWIVGLFGIYLSILIFFSILDQLVYDMGVFYISNFLNPLLLILSWGLVLFIAFWIAYIIIFFYKSLENTFKYQFGGFRKDIR